MNKIIIADDEPWTLYRIQNLLKWEEYGFELIGTAGDGLTALELIKEKQPALLLSDIRMPGLDGLELVRELKQHAPNTAVIFVTGFSEFSYAQEALRQGVFDYLVKPVRKEDLEAVLERIRPILEEKAVKSPDKLTEPITQFQKIMHAIDENYMNDIHLTDIADQFFLTANYLSTLIKKETGYTFSELLIQKRITLAKKKLAETDQPIQEIIEDVGYKDYSCFIRLFKKHVGCTPAAYRRRIFEKL